FATDPETCRIRNERAKASDPLRDVHALAAGWAQGLPMAGCTDGTPVDCVGSGSLYRL
ncbi:MAG: monooxygenase, partial [Janthinobacterium sp.]